MEIQRLKKLNIGCYLAIKWRGLDIIHNDREYGFNLIFHIQLKQKYMLLCVLDSHADLYYITEARRRIKVRDLVNWSSLSCVVCKMPGLCLENCDLLVIGYEKKNTI